jgi:glyoxylase-like metal-dependent hydrolase (beta-lactamase superfamily II)
MLQIKQFTFSPMAENTFVLYNEDGKACIIDPGCYFPAEKKELSDFLEKNGLQVTKVLLTHTHLDHVFGLKWAVDTYGCTPYMHPLEQPVLDRGPQMGSFYGLIYPAYTGSTIPVAEGEIIYHGKDLLKVIFAPGHSPGHVCYYCNAQQFIIGGDVLFQGSIGRTDLPGGHHETLLQNIRTKLFVLPEQTVVHCGHGPSTTIGEEKRNNPYFH